MIARPKHRRGMALLLVLMVAMVVFTLALSAILIARIQIRDVAQANDWEEAGTLAISAVDWGLTRVQADSNWRKTFQNNVPVGPISLGRGTVEFRLVDETGDGDLANDERNPARVYGVSRVGSTVRVYSALLPGLAMYNVLETACYAAKDVSGGSHATFVNGPMATAGTYTADLSGTTGDVEAANVVGSIYISGKVTVPGPPRTMPPASVFDLYSAMATVIPYSSIPAATMIGKVLSANSNPYGTPNAKGVYRIDVPAGSNLTLQSCRCVATLLVTVGNGATFTWTSGRLEQPPTDYPTLIIKASGAANIAIKRSAAGVNEWALAANLNPIGTPCEGVEDSDTSDSYAQVVDGLIHVIGASTTTTLTMLNPSRCFLTEGSLAINSNCVLTANPVSYLHPPPGYGQTPKKGPVPGSWRWEAVP